MMFIRIRRAGAWASLAAALAFVAPAGGAMAATHGQPTALTITPELAQTTANASTSTGVELIQVAQNNDAKRRKVQRQKNANRRQVNRQKNVNRRQVNRQQNVNRRQVNRHQNANRRYVRRHRYNNRWYYYDGNRWYDDSGAYVAAGLIGLATGALIGSAMSNSGQTVVVDEPAYGVPAPYTAEWYRQCDLKYNSFRASDGTFLGYDGVRHRCRLP
ncbi:BA14K family protein [Acuticoccus mangrovi]|nr:BA14K family protein [Acuticoccus mangrovi]